MKKYGLECLSWLIVLSMSSYFLVKFPTRDN